MFGNRWEDGGDMCGSEGERRSLLVRVSAKCLKTKTKRAREKERESSLEKRMAGKKVGKKLKKCSNLKSEAMVPHLVTRGLKI